MFKYNDMVIDKTTDDVYIVTRTPRSYERIFESDEMFYTVTNQHVDFIISKSSMEGGRFTLKL